MMPDAIFTVTCAACGEIDLAADQIWLVLTGQAAGNRYAYQCPRCSTTTDCAADPDTIALLARFVLVEELDIPAEAFEAHRGTALTTDDLIDLMLAIEAFESGDEPGAGLLLGGRPSS